MNSRIRKRIDDENSQDTDSLLRNQKEKLTLNWEEIPAWMRDNVYITDGYRRQTNNYRDCIKSLWYLHNESVNIWSHLLTFFLFVGLGIKFLLNQPFKETLTTFDITYFFLFIVGALLCLGFSASFHCFSCHSEKVAATWNRCDYAGITCLIVGSFFPVIYYGFHCHQLLQIVYLSCIMVLGSITAAVTLMKHFRTPAYRWVRATLFMALGLFGIVPTFHGIWIYGINNAVKTISLGHMALMAFTYIAGALIYGARFPESAMPGKFNIFGASHQIFHVCVTIAVLSHYLGVMSAMAFWHDVQNQEFCKTSLL
ncbi:hemolysin-III related-domain-containing protein [Cokeromyces recurvatus]|uniref:hemolysin-III related-domain-containing protein n=1 Tax=Cokeromyces recurvatus TaxID=90255 RepID=UPI002220418C|nr:hemolysin-III related-domain-containing protein [Cokeromyces recurvatus]KAI7905934.1 hemolysin-III related-domain-containing protein [Cokeromyces recurvatus]